MIVTLTIYLDCLLVSDELQPLPQSLVDLDKVWVHLLGLVELSQHIGQVSIFLLRD